jgi:hypothetical protein
MSSFVKQKQQSIDLQKYNATPIANDQTDHIKSLDQYSNII